MVLVTDLEYNLETPLVKKLDLMIKRCEQPHPKRDALLIVEGGEGEGKSNSSTGIAYYVKSQTNREIHLFFRLKALIDFAKSTERMIIVWDEPALDALSTDWYKKVSKDLIRLLMVVRKKRHFFIFNLTKFYKFAEYIVVDRALGLIHMYSRREIEPGRFIYVRRRDLEALYLGYNKSKKRLYKKYTSIRGSFPDILEKLFDKMGIFVEGKPNSTYADYEREKDKAILSVGSEEERGSKDKEELHNLKYQLGSLEFPITSREELANQLSISPEALANWLKRYRNE